MRIVATLTLLLSIALAGCTGGVTTATQTLTGNWNVVLTQTATATAPFTLTFGIALTQTNQTLSASSIPYTGNPGSNPPSPAASDPCLTALPLTGPGTVTGAIANAAQATTSGTTITTPSFPATLTLTLSDATNGTTITLNGQYQPGSNLYQGTFSLDSTDAGCVNPPASGLMVMVPQSEPV